MVSLTTVKISKFVCPAAGSSTMASTDNGLGPAPPPAPHLCAVSQNYMPRWMGRARRCAMPMQFHARMFRLGTAELHASTARWAEGDVSLLPGIGSVHVRLSMPSNYTVHTQCSKTQLQYIR